MAHGHSMLAIAADAAPYTVECDSADRAAWLTVRNTGLGASEAPAILGESKWASALSVYAEKVGAFGEPDLEAQTEAQYWGLRLEKIVAEEYTRRTGTPHDWHGMLLRSKRYPWALATLDAESEGDPLECKTAHAYKIGAWSDGAPRDYIIQCHQQMLVTDAPRARVACLVGGQRFMWDLVERDETLIRKLIHHGTEFWKRVQNQDPPPPDGSDASDEALDALYKFDPTKCVALPGSLIELDDERAILKDRERLTKARLKEINALIRFELGDATEGHLANGVVYMRKKVSKREYTVAASTHEQLKRKAPKGR